MLPTRHLLEFLLTVYILILIPGPSVVFVVSRGVWGRSSRRLEATTGAGGAMLIAVGVGLAVTTRRG